MECDIKSTILEGQRCLHLSAGFCGKNYEILVSTERKAISRYKRYRFLFEFNINVNPSELLLHNSIDCYIIQLQLSITLLPKNLSLAFITKSMLHLQALHVLCRGKKWRCISPSELIYCSIS